MFLCELARSKKQKATSKKKRKMNCDQHLCVASKYFPTKCTGYNNAEPREVIFKYRDSAGNKKLDTLEEVSLCYFHYDWLKTMGKLKMRGETPEYAVDDLLENFDSDPIYRVWRHNFKNIPNSISRLFLVEGDENDGVHLNGDNDNWELNGMFSYNRWTSKLFEIEPITDNYVIEWLIDHEYISVNIPDGMKEYFWHKKERKCC